MYVPTLNKDIPTKRLVWNKSGFVDPSQVKIKRQFVKGPIPLPWLCTASRLPGRTLHVGMVLWYLAGVCSSKDVKLTTKKLKPWGISHDQKTRGLAALERAGLVKVKRGTGRNPRVLILESVPHD
jgi:hypothetical protein